jgi:predicted nucleotidyltransferase
LSRTYHETLAVALAEAVVPPALEEVHLFGAARRDENPDDVDVLLVYAPGHEQSAMRQIADPIRTMLEPCIDRPLDLLVLSSVEMEQTQFSVLEGSDVVWRRA